MEVVAVGGGGAAGDAAGGALRPVVGVAGDAVLRLLVGGDELEAVELRRRLEGRVPEGRVGVELRDVAVDEVDLERLLPGGSERESICADFVSQFLERRCAEASDAKGSFCSQTVHCIFRHLQQASIGEKFFLRNPTVHKARMS